MSRQLMVDPEGARIVVKDGSEWRPGTAIEILALADDPTQTIGVPGIRFHRTTAQAVVRLLQSEAGPVVHVGARDGERLADVSQADDHVLIGDDWFPLGHDQLVAARAFLGAGTQPLTLATYADLFRGLDRPFEISDELGPDGFQAILDPAPDQDLSAIRLYRYQAEGVRWLTAHSLASLGGILADEMGLGKTPQLIALLEHERRGSRFPNLVVIPRTLMENWSRELQRFAPAIQFYRHVGPKRVRRPDPLRNIHLVLTTYDLVVLDRGLLGQIEWNVVATDEAQAYKNPETQRAAAISKLKRRVTIALTGTPLENRPLDLWSLSEMAEPGFLGSRAHFERTYEETPGLLRSATRPLMLRREVAAVADDLPSKIAIDVPLEMFAPEADGYDRLLEEARARSGQTPLAAITRLRLYTGHPHAAGKLLDSGATEVSAKLNRLLEIVEEFVTADEQFIIFSAFHHVSDLIAVTLERRLLVPVKIIDGRTALSERQLILDEFGEAKASAGLVLSPAVAGVGLNIVAANHVLHYTLEWNPAREDQATARAWRRGQVRPVTVHRFFYAGTIDEVIDERLQLKRRIFSEAVGPVGAESEADLRALIESALSRRAVRESEETL